MPLDAIRHGILKPVGLRVVNASQRGFLSKSARENDEEGADYYKSSMSSRIRRRFSVVFSGSVLAEDSHFTGLIVPGINLHMSREVGTSLRRRISDSTHL